MYEKSFVKTYIYLEKALWTHIDYALTFRGSFEPIKRYDKKFIAPLYMPINRIEQLKAGAQNVVYINTAYFNRTGVAPVKIKGDRVLKDLYNYMPKYIVENIEVPDVLSGFFITDNIRIPTLRKPYRAIVGDKLISPIYVMGIGFSPHRIEPILEKEKDVRKVWYVSAFFPLAVVIKYRKEENKEVRMVISVKTVFVGKYFTNSHVIRSLRGSHYAHIPLFVPRRFEVKDAVLLEMGKMLEVYFEHVNDMKIEEE